MTLYIRLNCTIFNSNSEANADKTASYVVTVGLVDCYIFNSLFITDHFSSGVLPCDSNGSELQ